MVAFNVLSVTPMWGVNGKVLVSQKRKRLIIVWVTLCYWLRVNGPFFVKWKCSWMRIGATLIHSLSLWMTILFEPISCPLFQGYWYQTMSESLGYWYQTMDGNLITHFSRTSTNTLEFKIIIPYPNRSLLKIIKTWLEGAKGVWPDELPGVLWAYRTTVRTPTTETPFKLAYGSEVIIPTEVHMASHRDNEEQLHLNLDLIDKVRMDAKQRTSRYKNLMARQYDAMVKPRHFNIRDLVLKRVSLAIRNPTHEKLGPNWEGPYRVINCKREGSYYLEALDGKKLEHPWNVEHLRRYYQ